MNTKASYEEVMWAIYNPEFGLYVDTAHTKKAMIEKHCSALGWTWKDCQKTGDVAIKVKMVYEV